RARTILSSAGHVAAARDTEHWFEPDIRFVYRQSAQFLVAQNSMHFVSESDPPNDAPGLATVVLDPTGRLIRLTAIPETLGRVLDASAAPASVNWTPL